MKNYIILVSGILLSLNSFAAQKFVFKTETQNNTVIDSKNQKIEKKISKDKIEITIKKSSEQIKEDKVSENKILDSIILKGAKGAGRTCFSILQDNEYSKDGIYTIMPSDIPFNTYCDMNGGGWSLLSVQEENELLTKNINNINEGNFGKINKTHRMGNSIVNSIRPYFSWKIEDNKNKVYFHPSCIINWQNNLNNNEKIFCNKGYDDEYFKKSISDSTISNYSNGIGMSNEGKYCSIRMFLSIDIFDRDSKSLIQKGTAFNCSGNTKGFIRLWFK